MRSESPFIGFAVSLWGSPRAALRCGLRGAGAGCGEQECFYHVEGVYYAGYGDALEDRVRRAGSLSRAARQVPHNVDNPACGISGFVGGSLGYWCDTFARSRQGAG